METIVTDDLKYLLLKQYYRMARQQINAPHANKQQPDPELLKGADWAKRQIDSSNNDATIA